MMTNPNQPTLKQKKYADDLGLNYPSNITSEEMSDLISRAVDKDELAPDWIIDLLRVNNLKPTNYIGKSKAYNWIWYHYIKNDEQKMVEWFVWHVCRHLSGRRWENTQNSDIDEDKIKKVSEIIISNYPKTISSMKRYEGYDLYYLDEYEDDEGFTRTGGSVRTVAYKTAKSLIDLEIEIKKNKKKPLIETSTRKTGRNSHKRKEDNSEALRFLLFLIIIVIIGLYLIFLT